MKQINEIDTFLTKEIKGQNAIWICPDCGETATQYQAKIIPSGRVDNYFPKYLFQIKETCCCCQRYRRFVPQTDILIDRFNKRLETIILKARGERDGL